MAWDWITKPEPVVHVRPDVSLALYMNTSGGRDMMLTVRLPDWAPERIDFAVGTGEDAGKLAFRPGTRARLRKTPKGKDTRYAVFSRPIDAPVDVYPAVGCEYARDGDVLIVTIPDWSIPLKVQERKKHRITPTPQATEAPAPNVVPAPAPVAVPAPAPAPAKTAGLANPEIHHLPWDGIRELAAKERVIVKDHADLAKWNRSRMARGLAQIAVAA